ncbi:MAG: fibrillarin-like pre-rRNA processing protein [Archaeoglobi archaeon]|nr:fibrillarin-like rRNA/tRNA 2'-O-methyltransferase [Candidatus Mnemosynella bozhongmuii]MDI3502967.1 fibrillarin-like pre-rRNA processing protein [Archaeoglobi archaeon]
MSKFLAARRKVRLPIRKGDRVLYLGVGAGRTAEIMLDLGVEVIYGVEVAPKPMKKFLELCERRRNLIPIYADARHPEKYSGVVERVDVIYQDVAQPDQMEIARKNAEWFLREEGHAIIMVKTRSIDVSASPKEVIRRELAKLSDFRVIASERLSPSYPDHWVVIFRR